MTLAFSQTINNKPTHFVEKIWQSLLFDGIEVNLKSFNEKLQEVLPMIGKNKLGEFPQKKHTIRRDKKNKWKAGNLIHFVINNRTKDRFQFAPVIKCVSTQRIEIKHYYDVVEVLIDGNLYTVEYRREKKISTYDFKLEQLAKNDGFDSLKDFLDYFNTDFSGKIIHWTNLKY